MAAIYLPSLRQISRRVSSRTMLHVKFHAFFGQKGTALHVSSFFHANVMTV